jgi:fumarate hydratase class I
MDKYTNLMLDHYEIMGMIGKAERGQSTNDLIRENNSIYLIAVGGAAYLVSQAIKKSKIVAFPELGMEAIYEFEVENMPVTVAVDTKGQSIHEAGSKHWKKILQK